MSTRKGTAVFLSDILNEAKERMLEKMQNTATTKVTENLPEVAEILGISAVLINDMKEKGFSVEYFPLEVGARGIINKINKETIKDISLYTTINTKNLIKTCLSKLYQHHTTSS